VLRWRAAVHVKPGQTLPHQRRGPASLFVLRLGKFPDEELQTVASRARYQPRELERQAGGLWRRARGGAWHEICGASGSGSRTLYKCAPHERLSQFRQNLADAMKRENGNCVLLQPVRENRTVIELLTATTRSSTSVSRSI